MHKFLHFLFSENETQLLLCGRLPWQKAGLFFGAWSRFFADAVSSGLTFVTKESGVFLAPTHSRCTV